MTPVFAVLLAMIAVFAIGYPFLRKTAVVAPRGRTSPSSINNGASGSMRTELESDLRTGILSKEEYDDLKGDLRSQAESGSGQGAPAQMSADEDDVERRVRELRQSRTGATQKPVQPSQRPQQGPRPVQGAQKKTLACPKCGSPYRSGDRFCTECGTRLGGGGR